MPECVYVAEREDGLCKVGCTANLPRRLRQLNRDYWRYHSLAGYWERDDAYQVEQSIHRALKEHLAIGREVYRIPTAEMVATISGLVATF